MSQARSSLLLKCFENILIGIDPAGLRTRNQPGSQRSKFCDPQIAFQGLTRKIAFGDSKSGALALKGLVQVIGTRSVKVLMYVLHHERAQTAPRM